MNRQFSLSNSAYSQGVDQTLSATNMYHTIFLLAEPASRTIGSRCVYSILFSLSLFLSLSSLLFVSTVSFILRRSFLLKFQPSWDGRRMNSLYRATIRDFFVLPSAWRKSSSIFYVIWIIVDSYVGVGQRKIENRVSDFFLYIWREKCCSFVRNIVINVIVIIWNLYEKKEKEIGIYRAITHK